MSELYETTVKIKLGGLKPKTLQKISELFQKEFDEIETVGDVNEFKEVITNFKESICLKTEEDKMIFLIDCNGECACDECMIEEESEVKTFPEFYANRGVVYQRVNNDNNEFLSVCIRKQGDRLEIAEQIADLLNNVNIKIKGD